MLVLSIRILGVVPGGSPKESVFESVEEKLTRKLNKLPDL
jgi:hypothetical protein